MNNCKNCGSVIIFSPKDKANVCQNCSSKFEINYEPWFEKRIYDENAVNPRVNDDAISKLRHIKCISCGANIALDEYHAQTHCPYCGNSEIVDTNNKLNLLIDSIIPFSFDKTHALEIVKKKIKSSFFSDKSTLRVLSEKSIDGVYINSYVFDIKSNSNYKGILRDTRIRRDKNGRSYTEIVNIPVSGNINCNLENAAMEANSNIKQFEINQILPYEHQESVKYSTDFMNGYILEYPDQSLENIYRNVRNVLDTKIRNKIVNKHLAKSIVTMDLDTKITDAKYNYSLLPVYFIHLENKKKKFRLVMNGQTGKINSIPKNGWKIFGLIASIFIIISIIVAILLN
ncbi:MAG: hypothetical protein ACLRFL_03895 [Clostridia bacterium]